MTSNTKKNNYKKRTKTIISFKKKKNFYYFQALFNQMKQTSKFFTYTHTTHL